MMSPSIKRHVDVLVSDPLPELGRQLVVDLDRRFYFDARHADHAADGGAGTSRPLIGALKNVVYSLLPPFLREGITLVLRKEAL